MTPKVSEPALKHESIHHSQDPERDVELEEGVKWKLISYQLSYFHFKKIELL